MTEIEAVCWRAIKCLHFLSGGAPNQERLRSKNATLPKYYYTRVLWLFLLLLFSLLGIPRRPDGLGARVAEYFRFGTGDLFELC
ncbi:MAG: hypothetical protein ACREDZ_01325, partial [Kiloniellales bacterium]